MQLARLLELAGLRNPGGLGGVNGMGADVSGVAYDSRQVRPGMVFVALEGNTRDGRRACDGHDFIGGALRRGAVAVVGTRAGLALSVPYIQVTDDRAAPGDLAGAYFGFPGDALELVGVTGTKGNTTTTAMIRHLLERAGRTPGSISTVGARWGEQHEPPILHFTTPEAPDLPGVLGRFTTVPWDDVEECRRALETRCADRPISRVSG